MENTDFNYEAITKLEDLSLQQSYALALAKTLREFWERLGKSAKDESQGAPLITWHEVNRLHDQVDVLFNMLVDNLDNIENINEESMKIIDKARKEGVLDGN